MLKATFAMSAIAMISSVTTLVVVAVGAHKAKKQVDEARNKVNNARVELAQKLIEMGNI